MRIDTHLAGVYLGSAAVLPRAVMPVPPAPAAPAPQREAGPRHEGGPSAQGYASIWPAAAIDARAAGLRVRQAIEAYTAVRDGDQRDYLRRVMGLETTA
jgi:hypothetical protein